MAFNLGSILGGGGTGAAYGGMLGGPYGAAAGALLGGLGSSIFGGSGSQTKNISTFDPQQKELYESAMRAVQGGGGPLADIYGQFDPALMRDYYEKAYAQPAYQDYLQNVIPGITGQFRGQNLQNSSYLGGALGQAGAQVQNNLQGQMAKMLYQGQQDQAARRANFLQNILSTNTMAREPQGPSVFDSLLGSLAGGAGNMLQDYFGQRNKQANMDKQFQQQTDLIKLLNTLNQRRESGIVPGG